MYKNISGFALSVEGTILNEFIHATVLDTVVDLVSITWWTPEKFNYFTIIYLLKRNFFQVKNKFN